METLFASGHVIDLILALLLCETLLLTGYRWYFGTGLTLANLLPNLLAGMGLLLAVRAALINAAWIWVAIGLTFALFAHIADMAQRWLQQPPPK